MKFSYLARIALFLFLQLVSATRLFGCQCGFERPSKNPWERARLREQPAAVVFEGVPTHVEMRWDALNVKDGELISTDEPGPRTDNWVRMLVTFQVRRSYKGDVGPEIQLRTGLGGGDCGARFAAGVLYLVYAYRSNRGELMVNTCSPGGWVGDSNLDADLRYLRKEKPVPADRVPIKSWKEENSAKMEEERKRHWEEYEKAFATVTGKICGTVKSREKIEKYAAKIAFLSTAGYSPVDHPRVSVNEDGSFCSGPLGPGKYDIFLTQGWGQESVLGVYYPGVPERKQARSRGGCRPDSVKCSF
jgi:hypothetical protein